MAQRGPQAALTALLFLRRFGRAFLALKKKPTL